MNFVIIEDYCFNLDQVAFIYLNKETKRLYIHFYNELKVHLDVPETCDSVYKCLDYFGIIHKI